MLCPIDNTELVITDRSGVEIDYCPKCRGVWLDRGELDKLIDRANSHMSKPRDDARYDDDRDRDHKGKKRKRGSFLEDMFDFF